MCVYTEDFTVNIDQNTVSVKTNYYSSILPQSVPAKLIDISVEDGHNGDQVCLQGLVSMNANSSDESCR